MRIYRTKAAMFGLDARIALAIFGALSVITGAALYQSISNAKAVSLLVQMKEVSKAWEQYYLDTGVDIPGCTSSNSCSYSTENLVSNLNSVVGWDGPYIAGTASDQYRVVMDDGQGFSLVKADSIVTWGDSTNWPTGACTSDVTCASWLVFVQMTGNAHTIIDNQLDGGDGADAGKFRWYGSGGVYQYFLKVANVKI